VSGQVRRAEGEPEKIEAFTREQVRDEIRHALRSGEQVALHRSKKRQRLGAEHLVEGGRTAEAPAEPVACEAWP